MTDSAPMTLPTHDNCESDTQLSPGSFKVLYVYTINDGQHDGRVKVGDATYHTSKSLEQIQEDSKSEFPWSTSEIEAAARKRIDEQTNTADIKYELLWAILAVKPDLEVRGRYLAYRDYEVHNILKRSGINKNFARDDKRVGEWFIAELADIQSAVDALCVGNDSISNAKNSTKPTLRSEQEAAVEKALKVFQNGSVDEPKDFLWNAIMRFGKTLSTYALVEKLEDVSKVLIMTHRPVVLDGWYEDYGKWFGVDSEWKFGSKKKGDSWSTLISSEKFFYFASIQDLRGSIPSEIEGEELREIVFNKNSELFGTDFDLVIVDESHEGNKTELAEIVASNLRTKYKLHLSGTPFNIIDGFDSDHVYNWSYTDEQKTAKEWANRYAAWEIDPENIESPGEVNPYAKLPKIEFRNYNISKIVRNHPAINPKTTTFDFGKFFEVDRLNKIKGEVYEEFNPFVDPAAIDQLLNMMTANDENGRLDPKTGKFVTDHRNFPFSRDNSKRNFAHTFWVVPSVESATALHERLHVHPGFSDFEVVNATGNNDSGYALWDVKQAIQKHDRTITLSVGKLTTGTTIPEWTGVFMLKNMRSPMLYMQTIFRVKSSGSLPDGRQKEVGYVFDFAPDRCLEMVSEVSLKTASRRPKYDDLSMPEQHKVNREEIEETLKYLPILAYDGGEFVKTDTNKLMRTLERVYINRTVDNGFHESKLFISDFSKLSKEDVEIANKLVGIVGKSTNDSKVKSMIISESILSETDKKVLAKGEPKDTASEKEKIEYTEAEKELKKNNTEGQKIVQLLKAISIRIPMLVFAADVKESITLDSLTDFVDQDSWKEFMPVGFEKEDWIILKKFFNPTVFEGACEEIQNRTRLMDEMDVLDRVAAIATLFSTFKRPDRETVLTPWKLVNRQYADTLGGLRFVNNEGLWYCKDSKDVSIVLSYEDYIDSKENGEQLKLDPQWVEVDDDLHKFWNDAETTVIDINSKTALYPLYASAGLWYMQKKRIQENLEIDKFPLNRKINDEAVWKYIIENQVFANCRVPYSRAIAQRVLSGYKTQKVNASVIDVLEVRKVLKNAKLNKFTKNGDLAKGKRSLATEEIADIWKWIFNPESISTRTGDGKMTVADKRARMILDMKDYTVTGESKILESEEEDDSSVKTFSSFDQLLEVVREERSEGNFFALVSNPPYQMETAQKESEGQKTVTNVFQYFQEVADLVSNKVCMIYPGERWVNRSGKGMTEFGLEQVNSKNLQKVLFWPNGSELFGVEIGIAGGVTIVFKDSGKDNGGSWDLVNVSKGALTSGKVSLPGEEIISLYPELNELLAKVRKSSKGKNSLFQRGFSQKLFGIESSFAEENPTKVILCNSDFSNKPEGYGWIKLFTNDKAGKGGRAVWFWVLKSDLGGSVELTDKWKVVISSFNTTGSNGRSPRCEILEPGTAFGRGSLGLGFFDNEAEAINFFNWLKTDTIRTLMASSGDLLGGLCKNIPDPIDFTNSNQQIDFKESKESLNDQLCRIYGFNEDDKNYMKSFVSKLAPFSKKSYRNE